MLRVSYLLYSPISCAFVINCLSREFSLPKFELLISGEQMSCANFFAKFSTLSTSKRRDFQRAAKNRDEKKAGVIRCVAYGTKVLLGEMS